jgi:hypothetical protein
MNQKRKYGIVFLLLLGVVTLLYLSNGSNDDPYEKKEVKVDEINWEKDYDAQSNHPYGTYFLHELINRAFDGYSIHDLDHSVQDYFEHDSLKVEGEILNYFFVGKNLNLYNNEVDSLLDFAEKGNNIFIAAEFFPRKLLSSLLSHDYQDYIREESDTSITLKFYDSQFADEEYELNNIINDVNIERRWRLWTSGSYSSFYKKNISKANYSPCYTRITYGKGVILLHTIPQAFTNQFLKSDTGRQYVETALSYLPEGTVLWDDYTQFVVDDGSLDMDNGNNNNDEGTGQKINTKSMIAFLMRSPPLRWAYLIILVGMLLFIVFMGKRRQKVIPTARTNINTSLEFTETISRIYLSKKQHDKLIKHMEIIFKNKMKTRYFIKYLDDRSYAERIAKKSGVSEDEINHLLELFKAESHVTEVSDFYLIDLYKKLQIFYEKAR